MARPRPVTSDFYALMQLSPSATATDIKQSYRQLAKRYHPDLNEDNPAAEDLFKQVQEAYHVLSSPRLRELYDLDYLQTKQDNTSDNSRTKQFSELHNMPHVVRMHARRSRDKAAWPAGLTTSRRAGYPIPNLPRRNHDYPSFVLIIFYIHFIMVVVATLVMLWAAFT